MLGRDESRYGEFSLVEPVEGVACALSVGSDPDAPSLAFKGDRAQPNEDGLLVGWEESRILLAVADGHRGQASSHLILARVADWPRVPANRGELALLSTGLTEPPWPGRSGTSLLLAVFDPRSGEGFGLAWGDSSLCLVGPAGARFLTRGNDKFLRGDAPCEPTWGEALSFQVSPDELLLAFTDGVNECHYQSPLTSVGADDLVNALRSGPSPAAVCREVTQSALRGVRGFPGGQDNLALIVASRL
ncbi:MAG: hypothetical protein AMXMBFR33_12380 [Candidatus Xenobia bacterium]